MAQSPGSQPEDRFVGREAERALFLGNFDLPPGGPDHRSRFHVRGDSGVGKTFLVEELKRLARERGALTVYVDEDAGSVPDALELICRQFAGQGRRLKQLERRLAVYKERRREAEAAMRAQGPEPASAGSRATVELGRGVLETAVPGAALLTRALPADLIAQGADRLRAGLSARFRNADDIDLVLHPEAVLSPVLLRELRAASAATRIVLFFDTYEQTGSFLDPWLHGLFRKGDEHGGLPETAVVVTAGQLSLPTGRWNGAVELPLAPFTDAEARRLLAGKGVVAEPVVTEVLRVTGGLPVLVSTLAEKRPDGPEQVEDPSADAVERFLRAEPEVRHDVARICALPRWLDGDVFRILIDLPDGELDVQYRWLRGLPFVGERGGRVRYHDVVREPMLRQERLHYPQRWRARHRRLAAAFAEWRQDVGEGLDADNLWADEEWRALRLEETYHLLCARPAAALADALGLFVEACREDAAEGRRWARMLQDAGGATDHTQSADWGRELGEALDDEAGLAPALDLLLIRSGLDPRGRAAAHLLRGREWRHEGEYARALEECDRAIELAPDSALAHYGRGLTLQLMDDYPAALTAFDRADELSPDTGWIIAERAETYRLAGRIEEAVADFDRALALDPTDAGALTGRGVCRHVLGRYDEALADFNRSLAIDDDLWTLVRRARLRRSRGEWEEAYADFDLAVSRAPDAAWVASWRGDNYRLAGRFEDAVTELGRAVALDPDHASAWASRGAALGELGRGEEAQADLDRAIALRPGYAWALAMRSRAKHMNGDEAGHFADLEAAVAAAPDAMWIRRELGSEYLDAGRHDEAIAALRHCLEQEPEDASSWAILGSAHRARENHTEAIRHLDRALALSPDYGWAYGQRARVGLATGRTEQALADLDRCVALNTKPDWARRTAVELLMLCERWDEAEARLTDDMDDLSPALHRHAGRWAEARRVAERLRTGGEPVLGTFEAALTVSSSEGLPSAAPLWRELVRLVQENTRLNPLRQSEARCFTGCALSDRPTAEQGLAEVLALNPDWLNLANLVSILTDLRDSEGADVAGITACLEPVVEARDAVRARYSE
ncbi:ATP-binding protein [Streptomyces justiciae]|uniref:ATP-binding protein n=1 Tax=Streptomyces justiciae TaxID=2780140 RepID=UPI002118930F|nr:ATP-binding protein [Streptomyces justiciae]MCW8375446.1 tetratricopeptide repeat protein [Streptomyces justiciae]